MKATSAELLEFGQLKALLGRYVESNLGRKQLEELMPTSDRRDAEARLAEAAEAIAYTAAASQRQPAVRGAAVRLRFDSLVDPAEALRKLGIDGACLEAKEIYDLTNLLARAVEIRRLLLACGERFPRLAARARGIAEFSPVVADLAGKITPEGEVADHASPALGRLRRDIDRQRGLVQESLERFLRRHREDGVLQEEFVTIRNDRFVVPVVAGRQHRLEGVVHGSSGSGHTLFVEPLETIELNNELVRLVEEEQREVRRVLREMTERLRAYLAAIHAAVEVLGGLDLLFAVARFAADFGCTVPRFSPPQAPRLRLREARHPLLEEVLRRQGKRVVPLTVTLEGDCRTLLISGPNTGGKTVALKTVGLVALMAQSGLPAPCAEAELPVFDQVLADIGDAQSIQESLSTFSAHITRVRQMLEAVGPDSLVLLDELGRATDPEEGGALGAAVLERCRAGGAFTLASTHLLGLKMYGATTPGVLNGSMGFDEATLEPTYLLSVGAPGKSAGLEIARRLGLPEELIEEARGRLGARERDLARFLDELHAKLEQVRRLQAELEQEKRELAAQRASLAAEWSRREAAKLKELERRCELVLARFEAEARQTIDRILAEVEPKRAAAARRRVAAAKRQLREELDATVLAAQDEARTETLLAPAAQVREGARVRLRSWPEPARVRRLLPHEEMEVEAGAVRLRVPVSDVVEVLPETPPPKRPEGVSLRLTPRPEPVKDEIHVIGQHADEARTRVEKFLDDAVLAGLPRVRIVHGHGMGVLRRVVAELLHASPHVARFYPAEPLEGGAGVTIAELRSGEEA
ncbi:MAG: endonuclease MutS2 [Bryobacterales bacterium]|nr:endonuclease MutS2 [Bryobacterales bacterium]